MNMRMYDIIAKKRDGLKLDADELQWFVNGYTAGVIPDYQAAALLMAIYINGMDEEEIKDLTLAMAESGKIVDLSSIQGIKIDKHSTGGVGDKTTLVVAPWVASLGVPIAKMSGGGLGYTGGTKDKLESIRGFRTSLSQKELVDAVKKCGIALVGQTEDIAPADKKLYALRDSIAAVESIPLITASIMSKKLAAGADAIVLDVKMGKGAFMKDLNSALELAQKMVVLGSSVDKKVVAIITSMEQPLGYAIGNAIEVAEAIDTLCGRGPADLLEVSMILGSYMLVLGQRARNIEQAKQMLEEALYNGRALAKFKEMVENQNGDVSVVDDPSILPSAKYTEKLICPCDGFVSFLDAGMVGKAAAALGASRETKDSSIDRAAGIKLFKKIGDKVCKGQVIAALYSNEQQKLTYGMRLLEDAYSYSDIKPNLPRLIYGIMDQNGFHEA